MTQADHIRLYASDCDICIAYEIHSSPEYGHSGMDQMLMAIRRQAWNDSLFALGLPSENWEVDCEPPDERAVWPYDGRMLYAWLQPPLLGGLVLLDNGVDNVLWPPTSRIDAESIRAAIERTGFEVVSASVARHMVAIVTGEDPFEDSELIVFRTAEVTHQPGVLPRPIIPTARRFWGTCAWRSALSKEQWDSLLGAPERQGIVLAGRMEAFLEVTLEVKGLSSLPTEALLRDALVLCDESFTELEVAAKALGETVRATRDYWATRYEVSLGLPPELSDKRYFWREGTEPPPKWVPELGTVPSKDGRQKTT